MSKKIKWGTLSIFMIWPYLPYQRTIPKNPKEFSLAHFSSFRRNQHHLFNILCRWSLDRVTRYTVCEYWRFVRNKRWGCSKQKIDQSDHLSLPLPGPQNRASPAAIRPLELRIASESSSAPLAPWLSPARQRKSSRLGRLRSRCRRSVRVTVTGNGPAW